MGPEIRRDEVWILIPLVIVERGLVSGEGFEPPIMESKSIIWTA